uniref:Uncharacterized protein n=1 Tax=Oryza glumipatula TaxID=40148 RepID=A0A0E0B7T0_9ORYZ
MKPGVLELQQAGIELLGTGRGLGSSRRCRAPAAALGEGRQRRAPTAGRYVGDRVGLQPASSGSSRSNGKGQRCSSVVYKMKRIKDYIASEE